MPFKEGSSQEDERRREDTFIPTDYDAKQLQLKEERLAKEAADLLNKTSKEVPEKKLDRWVEEKALADKQRAIQEKLGVKDRRKA
ncbi:MAG: hypothetical protein NT094_05190, partial [Candidatus Staskawiczbacteria bacterium]|nr:hypothetical protein [Candidatus Staskawiczbacteria bacterium]